MPELSFQVERAESLPFAAAPLLVFKLRVANAVSDEPIHSVALRCQVRIEPARRGYSGVDPAGLRELFGEPHRWGQTLRSMLWVHTSVVVLPFIGETMVDLPVPCTFDFNVAATKYFHALEDGEVPLCLLFSGSVFYEARDSTLQVCQIPWEKEASFRLPVAVWKKMMNDYYPNSAWLNVRQDVFDRLYRYKVAHGLPTWEQTFESLLTVEESVAR